MTERWRKKGKRGGQQKKGKERQGQGQGAGQRDGKQNSAGLQG